MLLGRLHSAFLEKLHESETKHVLPYAVPEYTLYEAALLGGSHLVELERFVLRSRHRKAELRNPGDVNVTFARYDVMGALLEDTHRSWSDVEAVLQAPFFFFFHLSAAAACNADVTARCARQVTSSHRMPLVLSSAAVPTLCRCWRTSPRCAACGSTCRRDRPACGWRGPRPRPHRSSPWRNHLKRLLFGPKYNIVDKQHR